MKMRYSPSPEAIKTFTTEQLRDAFMVECLFVPDQIELLYSHVDRMVVGGVLPQKSTLLLEPDQKTLGTSTFLERRELGVVNVGQPGTIVVDGTAYEMAKLDVLYVGKGAQKVEFKSSDPAQPARFYLCSTPAHADYPTTHAPNSKSEPNHLGSINNSNERTIFKYIHADGVKSCQLVMGLTLLKPGNMWNTMPAHIHSRRMEAYFYFDIPDNNVVFHLMGEPNETRHLVMRNEQAVISPSWSIHAGVGTANYGFVWAMAGENQLFSDMDPVAMTDLC